MQQYFYTIYDDKTVAHMNPYLAPNDGVAIRLALTMVTDPKTQIGLFPQDYTLYYVAVWRAETGQIEPDTRRAVGNLLQLKNQHLGE